MVNENGTPKQETADQMIERFWQWTRSPDARPTMQIHTRDFEKIAIEFEILRGIVRPKEDTPMPVIAKLQQALVQLDHGLKGIVNCVLAHNAELNRMHKRIVTAGLEDSPSVPGLATQIHQIWGILERNGLLPEAPPDGSSSEETP